MFLLRDMVLNIKINISMTLTKLIIFVHEYVGRNSIKSMLQIHY